MPFRVEFIEDADLAYGFGWDLVTKEEIVKALEHGFLSNAYHPGIDRITVADPKIQLHQLDLDALDQIKEFVFQKEAQMSASVAFQSALVSLSPASKHILQLYKALWDQHPPALARFGVFSSISEALRWLGRPADFPLPRIEKASGNP